MKIKTITNPEKIDKCFIETEIDLGNNVIVQFEEITYDDEMLSELNILAKKLDRNFQIRFYGHDKKTLDCKTLLKVDNVKNLSINCLKKVKNFKELTKLENLEKLIIGIDDFKEVEILNSKNFKTIVELNLASSKNNGLNLEHLKNFKNLTYLGVSGSFKNTDSIGELTSLKTLYLSSISSKISLEFVNHINSLKHLYITLGNRESIDEINGENLETLKLLWIRNLKSLNNISRFKNLKYLQVENQSQIKTIEFDKEMESLERLGIINCKGLNNLIGVNNLVSLKMLVITRSPKLEFENIVNQKLPSTIELFNFITERKKIDKEIKEKIRALGYKTT